MKAFVSLKLSPFKLNKQLNFLHLHLERNYDWNSFFKYLNDFEQLIQLELNVNAYIRDPFTLILPNLNVLYVRGCIHHNTSFVLNTPKLEVLDCGEISNVQVEHPETIKQLKCDFSFDANSMAIFKKVQVLDLSCTNSYFDGFTLTNWPELKELHLSIDGHDDFLEKRKKWEEISARVSSVFDQKVKRKELKFYLHDVLMVNYKQLDDYDLELELFWMKNWKLLRCKYALSALPFNKLMKLRVELSTEFLKQFPGIQLITATGPVVARDRFEWLLQNASEVRKLWLTNTGLEQAAMERLPKLNNRLTDLKLKKCQINNFDFVLQFEQLQNFETDQKFDSLNWAAKAFRELKQLKEVNFRTNIGPVRIYRSAEDKYMLSIQRDHQWDLKWDELVLFYDQKRADAPDLESSESDSRSRSGSDSGSDSDSD